MHHRALHLSFATLSFSSALQVAAIRAWSRRYLSKPRDVAVRVQVRPSCTKLSPSPGSSETTEPNPISWAAPSIVDSQACQGPSRQRPRTGKLCSVVDIDPNVLTDEEMTFIGPGRSDNADIWEDWDTIPGTGVSSYTLSARRHYVLLPAKSKNSLQQNLLSLINQCDPIPSLPALVDYHDMNLEFQSARSYNLLIDLALRHASIGTVQWLFWSMKIRGVSPNNETSKLHVRWLVRTRRWDQLLKLVRKLRSSRQNFPLPIWLELFPPARRGSALPSEEVNSATPDEVAMDTVRHQLLVEIKTWMIPEKLLGVPPRLVYHMIRIMFQSGDHAAARSWTVSYLANLPGSLPYRLARSCLELIHLHLIYGSSGKGLKRFYEARRTLFALLKLHRAVRPTSSTLLLLLAPLRAAKRCGTIGWKVLQSFQSQFGLRVVDSRVRRRIVTLASKEGRVDIIDRVISYQLSFHHARRSWKLEREVLGGMGPSMGRISRAPQRKILKRNGKNERAWRLLNRRLQSRMVGKQSKK